MKKLSPAQEKVLRQVADGKVKLVYVGDNDHSVRVWNAVDKDGRKINPTYDALIRLDLVFSPYIVRQEDNSRKVGLTTTGEELLALLGPAGRLVAKEFEPGTGTSWMMRVENDTLRPYVLYRDGKRYDTYYRADSAWAVLRSHCPLQNDLEASVSR